MRYSSDGEWTYEGGRKPLVSSSRRESRPLSRAVHFVHDEKDALSSIWVAPQEFCPVPFRGTGLFIFEFIQERKPLLGEHRYGIQFF